jgi:hypothetical protein
MKRGFSRQIIEKSWIMNFFENSLSGNRRTDRQIHMAKVVDFEILRTRLKISWRYFALLLPECMEQNSPWEAGGSSVDKRLTFYEPGMPIAVFHHIEFYRTRVAVMCWSGELSKTCEIWGTDFGDFLYKDWRTFSRALTQIVYKFRRNSFTCPWKFRSAL